ncbi:MAG: hypothetical protein IJQ93_09790 [Bacteroidales bacterium]|nr:hypothetical protein [Bacteroidales bacterium]
MGKVPPLKRDHSHDAAGEENGNSAALCQDMNLCAGWLSRSPSQREKVWYDKALRIGSR